MANNIQLPPGINRLLNTFKEEVKEEPRENEQSRFSDLVNFLFEHANEARKSVTGRKLINYLEKVSDKKNPEEKVYYLQTLLQGELKPLDQCIISVVQEKIGVSDLSCIIAQYLHRDVRVSLRCHLPNNPNYKNDHLEIINEYLGNDSTHARTVEKFIEYATTVGLKSIDLSRVAFAVTGDVLKKIITSLPEIKKIDLFKCELLKSSDLECLSELKELTHFSRIDWTIDHESFQRLAALPNLKHLELGSTNRLESFSSFSRMNQLEFLKVLDCSHINEDDLKFLPTTLKSVSLSTGPSLTDKGLKHFARLEELEELVLKGSPEMKGEGIVHLTKLQKLESLILHSERLSGLGISLITDIQSLKTLSFRVTDKITTKTFALLSKLKHLDDLTLSGSVKDSMLEPISLCKNLRSLTLEDCVHISDRGLHFAKAMKKLETLSLVGVFLNVSERGLDSLRQIDGLSLCSSSDLDDEISDFMREHY